MHNKVNKRNKEKKENGIYVKISIALLIIGLVISIYLIIATWRDGFFIWGNNHIDFGITGQVGDFIGGVVGTAFALAGTLLIYLSFKEQINQNKKEGFESTFFEMIHIHRQNVSEMSYRKDYSTGPQVAENRRVFKVIFEEFLECYREVKKFSNSKNSNDYILEKQRVFLNKLKKDNNLKVNIIELAIIDIAYSIVFFGATKDGLIILKSRFEKKYNHLYYYPLLKFIKLKPRKDNSSRWNIWTDLNKIEYKEFQRIIREFAKFKSHHAPSNLSPETQKLLYKVEHIKYYGGHQHRLGHYFRHLFQSYKYLNYNQDLNEQEKYYYGKTLRAQLSTYEQALIFINSISSLGWKWELTPEYNLLKPEENLQNCKLITRYNLIKNLPGFHFFGIRYMHYYPNIAYETIEQ